LKRGDLLPGHDGGAQLERGVAEGVEAELVGGGWREDAHGREITESLDGEGVDAGWMLSASLLVDAVRKFDLLIHHMRFILDRKHQMEFARGGYGLISIE